MPLKIDGAIHRRERVDMLALFSAFVKWLRRFSVRALKQPGVAESYADVHIARVVDHPPVFDRYLDPSGKLGYQLGLSQHIAGKMLDSGNEEAIHTPNDSPARARRQPPNCTRTLLKSAKNISIVLIFSGLAFAQSGFIQLYQATSPASQIFNNINPKYNAWTVMYNYSGSGTFSIELDCAADATPAGGTPTPGSFSACTNVITGSNPSTTPNYGYITFVGYTPWLKLNLTAISSGNMTAVAVGFNPADPESGSGGGCASPCKVIQNQPANSTASWTSATALNTTVAIATTGYSNVNVMYFLTGTVFAGAVTFEASPDNTNWQPIGMGPITTNTGLVTIYPLISGTNAWQMFVGGFLYFRVRLSTVITGTGTANFFVNPSVFGTEFAEAVGNNIPSNLQAEVQGSVATGTALAGEIPVYIGGNANGNKGALILGPSQNHFALSAATDVVLVSGTSGKTTYLTRLSVAWDAAATATIRQGTTSSTPCDTSTATIDGPYGNANTTGLFLDYGSDFSPLTTTSTGLDICLHLSTSATGGGGASYSQF